MRPIIDRPDSAAEDVVAVALAIFVMCVIFALASLTGTPGL